MESMLLETFPFNLMADVYKDRKQVLQIYVPRVIRFINKLPKKDREVILALYVQKMSEFGIEMTYEVERDQINTIRRRVIRQLGEEELLAVPAF
jgi:hypothetical protein